MASVIGGRKARSVDIQAELGEAAYGLFATLQPTEFKRVLSNLVNNAVEGIADRGAVTVRLRPCGAHICVEVADTGAGIPAEILAQLTQRGATFGKAGGSGLGLFHARESVERWGGMLRIDSTVGQGTTVTVQLPAAAPAAWFVPALTLHDGMTIVVLDDDPSIHDLWEGRLTPLRAQLPTLTVRHCMTAEEMRAWHEEGYRPPAPSLQRRGSAAVLFLVDYELLGQTPPKAGPPLAEANGLTLIEQLQIQQHAILVTSRYEEPALRAKCAQLGVQLIPKGLAGFVPLRTASHEASAVRGAQSEVPQPDPGPRTSDLGPHSLALAPAPPPDYVLIDDEEIIRLTWQYDAKRVGKTVQTFATPAAFLAVAHQIAKTTPIYVDSNLGNGTKGEEVSKAIHELGFEQIYLATGYNAADFPPLPWLTGIRGKDPPWISV